MKTLLEIRQAVEAYNPRSAWNKGVKLYALELIENLEDRAEHEGREPISISMLAVWMLNGARDYSVHASRQPYPFDNPGAHWRVYSYGGSALIYDGEIAERLCTASELKRLTTKAGYIKDGPNPRETWLDCQARALYQAAALVQTAAEGRALR